MSDLKELSDKDLIEMTKIHFNLLAEAFSVLASRPGDNSIIKMGVIKNGHKVDCVIAARKDGA